MISLEIAHLSFVVSFYTINPPLFPPLIIPFVLVQDLLAIPLISHGLRP